MNKLCLISEISIEKLIKIHGRETSFILCNNHNLILLNKGILFLYCKLSKLRWASFIITGCTINTLFWKNVFLYSLSYGITHFLRFYITSSILYIFRHKICRKNINHTQNIFLQKSWIYAEGFWKSNLDYSKYFCLILYYSYSLKFN